MKREIYSTGRELTYAVDKMGRAASISGVLAGRPATAYASNAQYEAHGGLKSVALGNNLVESWSYIPSRQQPWKIQLATTTQPSSVEELLNDYCPSTPFLGGSCASNNGNVMGQKRGSLGAATTVYTYDYLNRLLSANESTGAAEKT